MTDFTSFCVRTEGVVCTFVVSIIMYVHVISFALSDLPTRYMKEEVSIIILGPN